MPELEEKVLKHLRALPSIKQQEVLNFIMFLSQPSDSLVTSAPSDEVRSDSFAIAAQRYVGCLKGGPVDLSTNPEYLSGFGIE